jgi:membrane protease YdiL (CAAX protease family)
MGDSPNLPPKSAQWLIATAIGWILLSYFFRGWLWTGLRKRTLSAFGTAAVTGAIWLGLHATVRVDLPRGIFSNAVILSLARHFGESVRASIALHAMYNCMLLVLVWLLTNGLL